MGVLQSLSSPIAYHRLMKSPLDDSEIFTSVTDLMTYCSSGAWYEGQKVSVTVSNGAQYHYQIHNGVPLIIPSKTWEPVWVNISDYTEETSDGGSHGMLIYHWNDYAGTKYVDSASVATLIEDPDYFSISDTVSVFKTNGNFYFMTRIIQRNASTETVYTYLHSQDKDPVEEYSSITNPTQTSAICNPTTLKRLPTSTVNGVRCASSYIRILPLTLSTYSKNYIVKVYAISDEYYEAWGGGNLNG